MKQSIIFLTTLLLLNCKQGQNEKNNFQQQVGQEIITDNISSIEKDETEVKYPCKEMIAYGFIGAYDKEALIDNQEELVLKLCKNNDNEYALSVESDKDWLNGRKERGKVYDYKKIYTSGRVDTDDGCILETGEELITIFVNGSKHSVWRVKAGKLIEMDKNKEYPCIDFDEGME
ncbi:hypothetical protein [Capnocytophaga felis]|uniref:Uncharacterized protein n=1 Tax=Capnocytophaga felis TaxID=2267611 RepID=A0A5M4BD78_9FLAO|nr:hypothetical protein [Capnocytophaga felis]GET47046.1 hypothetical protein RCZ01_23480 [Capnocytophaga felis]GET49649.1 hypothetical protein RCZ02_24800 [Capnocytophaga felis]